MSPSTTRRLLAVHRVCGLIVSLNMALFAFTGAILIFHEEIDAALGVLPSTDSHEVPEGALARAVEKARAEKPTGNMLYVFRDTEEMPGMIAVGVAEGSHELEDAKPLFVEASTGRVMPKVDLDGTFTNIVLRLHAQLLLGPGGALLVGFIGLVLLTFREVIDATWDESSCASREARSAWCDEVQHEFGTAGQAANQRGCYVEALGLGARRC